MSLWYYPAQYPVSWPVNTDHTGSSGGKAFVGTHRGLLTEAGTYMSNSHSEGVM